MGDNLFYKMWMGQNKDDAYDAYRYLLQELTAPPYGHTWKGMIAEYLPIPEKSMTRYEVFKYLAQEGIVLNATF